MKAPVQINVEVFPAFAKVKPTTAAIKNQERTNKLYVNLPRESEVMKNCIYNKVVPPWNALPDKIKINKPGTAQVGAISKAQKQQKDFKVSKYSLLRYRKNPKVEPNWRTRGDTFRFFIHSVANHQKIERGALLVKKKYFEKKSHNAEKLKGGTLWDFSTSVLSENSKKIEGVLFGEIFFEKSLTEPKIL